MSASRPPEHGASAVSPTLNPFAWSSQGLSAQAGDRPLFTGLSLDVPTGHWVNLTGPNGVGKTTFLRLLAGLGRPESGALTLAGQSVSARDLVWRAEVLYVGHASALKAGLSAYENLALWIALDHGRRADRRRLSALLEHVGLSRRSHVLADRLSAGQKKRLQLARLMASHHALWLLDEPANALDEVGQRLLNSLIDKHLENGGTAVIASHHRLALAGPAIDLDMTAYAARRPRQPSEPAS